MLRVVGKLLNSVRQQAPGHVRCLYVLNMMITVYTHEYGGYMGNSWVFRKRKKKLKPKSDPGFIRDEYTTHEAARYLGEHYFMLIRYAQNGGGPEYIEYSPRKRRYTKQALDQWRQAQ